MTTRRRRQQRPTPTQPVMTIEQTRQLARDLVRDLAEHAGNPDEVRGVLLAWLDSEDTTRLGMAAMAAIQIVFADCLTRVPVDQIPAGALTMTPPTERTP